MIKWINDPSILVVLDEHTPKNISKLDMKLQVEIEPRSCPSKIISPRLELITLSQKEIHYNSIGFLF